MPHYAFLPVALHCPACRTVLDDLVWFQWGFTRFRQPLPECTYAIGDPIRWQACQDGKIPPWTYFHRNGQPAGANLGTPDEVDVIVRDWAQVRHYEPCPACGAPLGGAAVEIREGRIARGWIARADELPEPSAVLRVCADGTLEVLVADDHRMDLVDDC
jgi:hypothetical protein